MDPTAYRVSPSTTSTSHASPELAHQRPTTRSSGSPPAATSRRAWSRAFASLVSEDVEVTVRYRRQ